MKNILRTMCFGLLIATISAHAEALQISYEVRRAITQQVTPGQNLAYLTVPKGQGFLASDYILVRDVSNWQVQYEPISLIKVEDNGGDSYRVVLRLSSPYNTNYPPIVNFVGLRTTP